MSEMSAYIDELRPGKEQTFLIGTFSCILYFETQRFKSSHEQKNTKENKAF